MSILDFLKTYQLYIFITIAAALLGWHFLAIKSAVDKNNAEWIERINNAPVQTKTDTIFVFVPQQNTGGQGYGTIVYAQTTKIDSLIAASNNKDDLIRTLASKKTYDTTMVDLGHLYLGYDPIPNLFSWSLTDRPPIKNEVITVIRDHLVPVPFYTWGIGSNVNGVGSVFAGVRKRFDDIIIEANYHIAGPSVGNNWNVGISWYFY
jgi:hypothetical protein